MLLIFHHLRLLQLILLLSAISVWDRGFAEPDTIRPVLEEITITPVSVDVTSGPQTITIQARATDDRSGVTDISLRIPPPSGSGDPLYVYLSRVSGTPLDGIYSGTAEIPQFSHLGYWTIATLEVSDASSNRQQYLDPVRYPYIQSPDLAMPGGSASVLVTGIQDLGKPTLTDVAITPDVADVASGPQTVTLTVKATDDLSGISHISATFRTPGGGYSFVSLQRRAGTELAGEYAGVLEILPFAEVGRWKLGDITVYDKRGNGDTYKSPVNDPVIPGFQVYLPPGSPSGFEVTGGVDTAPPLLVDFSFTPGNVNASSYLEESIAVTARATDLQSGVASVSYTFRKPSGDPGKSPLTELYSLRLASGTAQNGVFTGTVRTRQSWERGIWKLDKIQVSDFSGNFQTYLSPEFYPEIQNPARYFPAGITTDLLVVNNATPVVALSAAVAASPSSVTLKGKVLSRGAVDAVFLYGLDSVYENRSARIPLAGEAEVPVSAVVTGLLPGRTYMYCLAALNTAGGTTATGAFTMPFDPSLYPAWSESRSVTGGPTDDDDGDGLCNLLEYAFGTDPGLTQPPGRQVPVLEKSSGESGYRCLFSRRKDRIASGLAYLPEFSGDLSAWHPAVSLPKVIASEEDLETVYVPFPVSLPDGLPPRFFRVTVRTP